MADSRKEKQTYHTFTQGSRIPRIDVWAMAAIPSQLHPGKRSQTITERACAFKKIHSAMAMTQYAIFDADLFLRRPTCFAKPGFVELIHEGLQHLRSSLRGRAEFLPHTHLDDAVPFPPVLGFATFGKPGSALASEELCVASAEEICLQIRMLCILCGHYAIHGVHFEVFPA